MPSISLILYFICHFRNFTSREPYNFFTFIISAILLFSLFVRSIFIRCFFSIYIYFPLVRCADYVIRYNHNEAHAVTTETILCYQILLSDRLLSCISTQACFLIDMRFYIHVIFDRKYRNIKAKKKYMERLHCHRENRVFLSC